MTERTTVPTPCAMPSQIAARPRTSAVSAVAIGPGPLRTARGAGRFAVERERLLLVVLRDRELLVLLRPFAVPAREDPDLLAVRDEAVVRLREPVGEDVRVAMLTTYPFAP
ncbi:hypothetical protein GCM10027076_19760 [Nocardioides montaniterrae]